MRAFEILEWDSQAFGFRVARIHEPAHDSVSLGDCLAALRRERVTLAYWFTPDHPELTQVAADCQGSLVDRKVTYEVELVSSPAAERAAQIQVARPSDLATLEGLSIQCGEYSRFARDPRFPRDRFESLYREWIRRSLLGILADLVLVWREDDGAPQGLITVAVKHNLAQFGLLGVDVQSRGRSIGRRLVQAAQDYAMQHGATRCNVVTQHDNLAACRMYEANVFRLHSVQRVHHFWFADA